MGTRSTYKSIPHGNFLLLVATISVIAARLFYKLMCYGIAVDRFQTALILAVA